MIAKQKGNHVKRILKILVALVFMGVVLTPEMESGSAYRFVEVAENQENKYVVVVYYHSPRIANLLQMSRHSWNLSFFGKTVTPDDRILGDNSPRNSWNGATRTLANWVPPQFLDDTDFLAPQIIVFKTNPHFPLHEAGIRRGDRIVMFDDLPATLASWKYLKETATEATVTFLRGDHLLTSKIAWRSGQSIFTASQVEHIYASSKAHPPIREPLWERGRSRELSYALAYFDYITKGDLTQGKTVAATGSVMFDGRVGGVGGLTPKLEAAVASGADIFFVPSVEEKIVSELPEQPIRIELVSSVIDAVIILCEGSEETWCRYLREQVVED